MTDDNATTAPDAQADRPVGQTSRRVANIALALAVVGWIVTAVAWLLPFRTDLDAGPYDLLATVAFFSRVYLFPMAIGWAVLAVPLVAGARVNVAILCMLTAIGWAGPEIWMAWPTEHQGAANFSVASMNLNKETKDASYAVKVLRQMNADVVSLQELSPEAAAGFKAMAGDLYPHQALYPDTGYNGMGILSKTPLKIARLPANSDERDFDVAVTLGGRDVLLGCVHLKPPQWIGSRRFNRREVGVLTRLYTTEARPVLLAGDYNFTAMTPNGCALRAAGFRDAQLDAGNGRNWSWPADSNNQWLPKVRIDTVYAKGPLKAVESMVGPDIGSDHRPIKTGWQWTN